jgi:hypothetical protein
MTNKHQIWDYTQGKPTVFKHYVYTFTELFGEFNECNTWKIGDTVSTVEKRIGNQKAAMPYKAKIAAEILLPEKFSDNQIHRVLNEKFGATYRKKKEASGDDWMDNCSLENIRKAYNYKIHGKVFSYNHTLRDEQINAANNITSYLSKSTNEVSRFLLAAKMRFGKVQTTYQSIKNLNSKLNLVLSYRVEVKNSWKDDADDQKFGYVYIDALNIKDEIKFDENKTYIIFASMQDILGTNLDGTVKKKWKYLLSLNYDMVVLDEVHYGINKPLAREIVSNINHTKELWISGTPIEILMSGMFSDENMYVWSYFNEQVERNKEKSTNWATENYRWLAPLTFMRLEPTQEVMDYYFKNYSKEEGFSFTKFFTVDETTGDFVHKSSVVRWLDNLASEDARVCQSPFNHNYWCNKLNHTFWYMPRSVAICKAMKVVLESHWYFKNFKIVPAYANNEGEGTNTLQNVIDACKTYNRTITLSCGKCNTGVTVKPWTSVFMLSDTQEIETYLQVIFRPQSPHPDGKKEDVLVVEFSPNREIRCMVEYAKLCSPGVNDTTAVKQVFDTCKFLSMSQNSLKELSHDEFVQLYRKSFDPAIVTGKFNSDFIVGNDIYGNEDYIVDLLSDFSGTFTTGFSTGINVTNIKKGKTFILGPKGAKKASKKIEKIISEKIRAITSRIPNFLYASDVDYGCVRDLETTNEKNLFETQVGVDFNIFKDLLDKKFICDKVLDNAIRGFIFYKKEAE